MEIGIKSFSLFGKGCAWASNSFIEPDINKVFKYLIPPSHLAIFRGHGRHLNLFRHLRAAILTQRAKCLI